MICQNAIKNKEGDFKQVNLYFEDESRFGLFTRNGKALTAKSVKPICPFQHIFQSTWIFGAFSPIDGSSLMLELPNCNTNNFQIFLNEFSKQNPDELKLIILDNGAFHKAQSLIIPDNVVLIFLPPYSPELNPAEKIWAKFKRDFTNRLFPTMEQLCEYVVKLANSLTTNEVISICGFDYIFSCNYWTVL